MAFTPETPQPNIDKLKIILLTSGLQQKDQSLFQILSQLIDAIRQSIDVTSGKINIVSDTASSIPDVSNETFITVDNETGLLPNSRQLFAGSGITLNTSIAGRITIDTVPEGTNGYWTILTNGDPTNPEVIFADGDVISEFVST